MLSIEDVRQFFRIHRALMFFVNRKLRVLEGKIATPEEYASRPPTERFRVHEALLANRGLIDAFVAENPLGLDEADLEVARSWVDLVEGKFFALRQLRKHMIFLTAEGPARAYGVVALFDPFDKVIGPVLPRMIRTTLLPFKGAIVYDGLISAFNISFGAGYRRGLDEGLREAKGRSGVITSLPPGAGGPPPRARKKAAPGKRPARAQATGEGGSIPEAARPAFEAIVTLTDAFSREYLDAEFAALCRKLAGVLARKRPSPLTRGKPASWAAGIARVIGSANFLGDPSQPGHMRMTDIDRRIGVSEATGSAKATAIRERLDLRGFEAEWTLPSRMDANPMIWMLQVNGLLMDIRRCPREAQEAAFRRGLIPYIPADRAGDPAGG